MIFLTYGTNLQAPYPAATELRSSSHFCNSTIDQAGGTACIYGRFVWRILGHLGFPIALLLLFCSALQAAPKPVREYKEEEQRPHFAALMQEYGKHKELPEGYELQALLALSHYPELREVRIRFIVDDVDIPLSSRPWWASMLRNAQNRTYLVVIDSEREGSREALLLKNQPFNAQVGIIGHELAHTVYYLERSFIGIVGDALCQLSACRIEFERATDRRLIAYGLGWQRYDHALYIRSEFLGSQEAALSAEGGGGAYMSPAELMREMERVGFYSD